MTMKLPYEIWGAIIGIGGAVLGYAFREYRNRVRPFFQITRITGDTIKRSDMVDVSKETSDKLKSTFYLDELTMNDHLGDVADVHERARQVRDWWPEDGPAVDRVLASNTDDELCHALTLALKFRSIEKWLLTLLASDKLHVLVGTTRGVPKIAVEEDEDDEGQVWFMFPNKAVSFGNHLKNAAIRAKCQPFIDAVKTLDHSAIKTTFTRFKELAEAEYRTSMECLPEIKNLFDTNSRWCFYCYLANLNDTPIIIQTQACLHIRDKTGVRYEEDCYIALLKAGKDGDMNLTDTKTPLVVPAGKDVQFALITTNTQIRMKRGTAVRECFERKESKCHATVKIQRVGLFGQQRFCSQSATFIATDAK
ncbi:MAG TPA: hypothetical protein DDW84_05475 [Phycisphaerales bacterium]|nr:hypothetical protein [Phycisphaerales bacterium]HBR18836.1 hypothetical protein [Phycisphaerales bacterium]